MVMGCVIMELRVFERVEGGGGGEALPFEDMRESEAR